MQLARGDVDAKANGLHAQFCASRMQPTTPRLEAGTSSFRGAHTTRSGSLTIRPGTPTWVEAGGGATTDRRAQVLDGILPLRCCRMQASMTHPSASTRPVVNIKTPDISQFPGLTSERWQRPRNSEAQALQRTERLREALCGVPFYAKRAEKARLAGDEMAYWLDWQGSQTTLVRPPTKSSTAEALKGTTSPSASSSSKT